jgi:two-component system sensor histidine kinase BaeS
MPSQRSNATTGFLRRLDVRLVLALASVAFVALLVSGAALSQFLPDYFAQQAESRLSSAANSTAILIQDTLERLEPAKYSSVSERQPYIQKAAQVAATSLAQGTVRVYYRDPRSLAAEATPEDPSKLLAQGLRLDQDVQPRSEDYTVALPDTAIPLQIVISDPYTSRAATLDQVRGTLIAAGVIAVIGSLLLGLLAARTLTGPINRLRRVSARLALGDLDQRAGPSGVVEIDQLAAQFNVMADRLAESLRLLQADRDRLREFIADVSHELRTPIAALRTFNDLQADGSVDDATRAEFIDRSREQLRRLEWLSTNLLDLSRIDAGIFPLDVRDGDLRDPIRSVVEAHAEMAEERGVTLTATVPGEVVGLRFDRERIVQLVNNLVGNALKFTPRGGVVDVEVTDAPGEAVVEVRDTGPGIPEAELPRIFERFYRGTNVGEARASGSGLGLAIARSIVEMHGGSIEVVSAVGRGTSFRAHLPRLSEPSLSVLLADRARPGARASEAPAVVPLESPAAEATEA